MGRIEAICISKEKGTAKERVKGAELVKGFGLEGDAHGGKWHRQVSLLELERIQEFRAEGAEVEFGAFGENIVISGIAVRKLPVGSILHIGNAVLEITQIGKECHNHCAIYHQVGRCIMPTEGVFARVQEGGHIQEGDYIEATQPATDHKLTASVITLSDRCAAGDREDKSGPAIWGILQNAGFQTEEIILLPDGKKELQKELIRLSDMRQMNLILTTGGTGLSPRDVTPEATLEIGDRNVPGIAEAIRGYSISITPRGMLSRGAAVLRGKTLIINLPGSEKAVREIMEYLLPSLEHGLRIAEGTSDD